MAEREDGGPAFPLMVPVEFQFANNGMSLRQWYAGQALVAYLQTKPNDATYEELAEKCYRAADAMIGGNVAAALPDMLAALKAVEAWWLAAGMKEPGRDGAPYAIFAVRAAIAKAEGRS